MSLITRVQSSRSTWGRSAGALVVLLAAALIPYLEHTPASRLSLYDGILAMIVVTIGLNVAMGMAGQFLLGIVAVFAVGGYAAGYVVSHHPTDVGLLPMCVIGALAGGIGGLIIGLPALRVGHFYLALVSLYAALVVPAVATEWSAVGGVGGIALFDTHPEINGNALYLLYVAIVVAFCALLWAIRHSTVGRRFLALAASEELAAGLGISGYRTKLLGSCIGSVIAGVAGAMYIYCQQYFGPTSGGAGGGANLATLVLAALVIGGTGTVTGPVIGGVLILGLNQFLTGFDDLTGAIFGALLIVFSIFLPQGITAETKKVAQRFGFVDRPRLYGQTVTSGVGAGPAVPTRRVALDGLSGEPATVRAASARACERLEVRGASRAFGGVTAVDSIDLTVEAAAIHGLIGSNGSGKTTLLNLISGFYRVDGGEIRIGDTVLSGHSAYAISRLGVARTFQTPKLILSASVLENVMPAAERRLRVTGPESVLRLPRGRRAGRQAREQSMEALDRLSLAGIANDPTGALPHGTRRLVEVARAIALQPRFFLLDEPAAGLSPTESDTLVSAMCRVADEGTGVLLIEHNVPLVLSIANVVTVMHQGSKLFEGTPQELRSDQRVAGAFLGIDVTEEVS